MNPLTIWTNQRLPDVILQQLRDRLYPHPLVVSQFLTKNVVSASAADPAAQQADVLYGQPDPADIFASQRVKLVQLGSAGYTRYDNEQFLSGVKSRGIKFCNASSLYDEPVAQHAAAMLLAFARNLPTAILHKAEAKWEMAPIRNGSFLLGGQHTLIVGYGAIARRLVELLKPFGLNITAFRRTPRGDENVHTEAISILDNYLPTADIVINILPSSPSTVNLFNADRLGKLKPGSVYLNLGRGDTTDQDALVAALDSGRLSCAFLDVTTPEPLPADHPLWKSPNCFITPHTAGGTRDEPQRMIEHFLANFDRFLKDAPLQDRIA